jgi:hypothetical protein
VVSGQSVVLFIAEVVSDGVIEIRFGAQEVSGGGVLPL